MIQRTIQHRSKKNISLISTESPKSSNKQDIIDYLLKIDFIPNYVQQLEWSDNYDILEDEIQDIWVLILSIDQEIWDDLYLQGDKAILRYLSGMIYRQICSKTSQLYKKYKRPKDKEIIQSEKVWEIYQETNEMPKNIFDK